MVEAATVFPEPFALLVPVLFPVVELDVLLTVAMVGVVVTVVLVVLPELTKVDTEDDEPAAAIAPARPPDKVDLLVVLLLPELVNPPKVPNYSVAAPAELVTVGLYDSA